MNRRLLGVLAVALVVLPTSFLLAKRTAPPEVPSVVQGGVEYRASRLQTGCVEALDRRTNRLVWCRQVYVVKYNVDLERDVQDVCIKAMELDDNALLVTNERGHQYRLDLDTLEVKVLKGALVERAK